MYPVQNLLVQAFQLSLTPCLRARGNVNAPKQHWPRNTKHTALDPEPEGLQAVLGRRQGLHHVRQLVADQDRNSVALQARCLHGRRVDCVLWQQSFQPISSLV